MTRPTGEDAMSSEHVEVLERLRGVLEHGKMGDKCLIAPDLVTAAIAALSAQQSGDWVLVPREASSEMLTAAIDAHLGFEGEDEVDAVWAAMISAAEQFGATAGHAVQDVGDGAEGGSRAPTRPTHFSGMFPRQDDPASSSFSHQAVDVWQFRPAVATHQLACRKRVRDCREGLLPTDNLPIYLEELAEANRLLDVVDRAAPQPPAEAQPVACDEDRFEQFLQAAIARSPEPLRELGEYLSGVLDDDQWPAADRLLLQLATAPPSTPVGAEGFEQWYARVDARFWNNWDACNAAYHAGKRSALSQQPAAPVLAKHQPCGCVICTCEDEQQCQGCGAKHCGNRADHPPYVGQQPAAVDGAATNSAVAAIQFALKDPEGMTFLRLWNEGDFDTLRREWPDAPVEVYIDADPLAAQQGGAE